MKISHIEKEYNKYVKKMKEEGVKYWSKEDFAAVWNAYSIDRKKGRIKGHLSIRERIEYKTQHKVAASVARRRSKKMRELYDVYVDPEAAKDMDNESWNAVLEANGINPGDLYKELKKVMSSRDAAKVVSQTLYGSE